MKRLDLGPRLSRRRTKPITQQARKHASSAHEIEIRHRQRVLPTRPRLDQFANLIHITRLAVGRQPHHLVLALVDPKAQVRRDRGVEQAEGVEKMNLLEHLKRRALSPAIRRRSPFAHPIDGEQGSLTKSRIEKGTRGVGVMMVEKEDRPVVAQPLPDSPLGLVRIEPGQVRVAIGQAGSELPG